MALKRPLTLLNLSSSAKSVTTPTRCTQCRALHKLYQPRQHIPSPTPFVPDVETFMTLIGRDMSKHAAKIPSWEALFTLSSEQLKASGLEPARARRYLLWWRDRFQKGIHGLGGDVKHVKGGVAELRIVERPTAGVATYRPTLTTDSGYRRVVSNMPATLLKEGAEAAEALSEAMSRIAPPPKVNADDVVRVKGPKVVRATTIGGRGIEYVKGKPSVALLKVKDGLWEQQRGQKIDGGERRRAEVRAKRAAAERKNAR